MSDCQFSAFPNSDLSDFQTRHKQGSCMKPKHCFFWWRGIRQKKVISISVPGWSQCSMPQKALNDSFRGETEAKNQHSCWPELQLQAGCSPLWPGRQAGRFLLGQLQALVGMRNESCRQGRTEAFLCILYIERVSSFRQSEALCICAVRDDLFCNIQNTVCAMLHQAFSFIL